MWGSFFFEKKKKLGFGGRKGRDEIRVCIYRVPAGREGVVVGRQMCAHWICEVEESVEELPEL